MSSEQEIKNEYDNIIISLKEYCKKLVSKVLRSNMDNKTKNNYIQQIRRYFFRNQEHFKKQRDDKLKIINNNYTALLIGIDYKNTSYSLNGCINDVNNITKFLNSQNISNDKISTLTDDTILKPTKENIINMFKKLLTNSSRGDNLVFYYSGHGSRVINTSENKDTEPLDDVLVPLDLDYIIDDELNEIIHNNLKPDVNLFVLIDCCHSGTMLDLKYNYPLKDNNDPNIDISSKDTISNVYYISGCKDEQVSMETYIQSKVQGAMTWGFLNSINTTTPLSWKALVDKLRENMKNNNFTQIPQFSSGISCDVNSKWIFSK